MSDFDKYNEIFDFLSAPRTPPKAYGNFVFGRADSRLVDTMVQMHGDELAEYFLITGGIGKDSGHLAHTGTPEAVYLDGLARQRGIPPNMIHLETKARNGAENARFGLGLIKEKELALSGLTVVAHATQLVRLTAQLRFEADNNGYGVQDLYRVPTDYHFKPEDPVDRNEAAAEILRLADWPEKGWLAPQPELPLDLVDFARHQQS